MNCPYLDSIGHCKSSPVWGGIYNPTVEEKERYCTNGSEMKYCPRLQLYQSHLEATGKGATVSNKNTNVNTNTNTNTNTNSSYLSLEVKDAFGLAYATVDAKRDISSDEKASIDGRLLILQRDAR